MRRPGTRTKVAPPANRIALALTTAREPAFNIPGAVLATVLVLIGVQLARDWWLGDFGLVFDVAFIPARAALLFGMSFDAEAAVRHGLALQIAEDPVAAALELAAGPAAAPREVVIATKASMRATAIPGFNDAEHHWAAKDIELGPQAATVESPEFKARLAAAQRR